MTRVRLADCPIGLFVDHNGQLCLKTEYSDGSGRIKAFIVESGEAYWGRQPQTPKSQQEELVLPLGFDRPMLELGRRLQAEVNHLRSVIEQARELLETGADDDALRVLTEESADV